MDNQDSYALPIIRRQLNSILHKEKGTTFLHFTEELHGNALRGYTRSGIPHPGDYNVEKVLNSIKQVGVFLYGYLFLRDHPFSQGISNFGYRPNDVPGRFQIEISSINQIPDAVIHLTLFYITLGVLFLVSLLCS